MIYGSTTPLQSVVELSDMGYHLVFRPLSGKQPYQTLHATAQIGRATSSCMHAEGHEWLYMQFYDAGLSCIIEVLIQFTFLSCVQHVFMSMADC